MHGCYVYDMIRYVYGIVVCIDYITKNGRGQLMGWREIEDLFAEKIGETGLGCHPTTGKLNCSDEWWDRKLKKPDAKKYRQKGVYPLLKEKWDHLFDDVVTIGAGCVSPSLNLESVDKSINVVDEIQNENGWSDEAMREYSKYSRLESLDNQENSFWTNFTKEVTGDPTNFDV
uniref:Myb/SANT-like domain-containing protein n=1 Tax=Lactuca sativa TaxID=4236 RepID=A0A9R1UXI1_LACSA|nr:hypothetical protein LSAT_V11C700374890 [Lactuca sativa]